MRAHTQTQAEQLASQLQTSACVPDLALPGFVLFCFALVLGFKPRLCIHGACPAPDCFYSLNFDGNTMLIHRYALHGVFCAAAAELNKVDTA